MVKYETQVRYTAVWNRIQGRGYTSNEVLSMSQSEFEQNTGLKGAGQYRLGQSLARNDYAKEFVNEVIRDKKIENIVPPIEVIEYENVENWTGNKDDWIECDDCGNQFPPSMMNDYYGNDLCDNCLDNRIEEDEQEAEDDDDGGDWSGCYPRLRNWILANEPRPKDLPNLVDNWDAMRDNRQTSIMDYAKWVKSHAEKGG